MLLHHTITALAVLVVVVGSSAMCPKIKDVISNQEGTVRCPETCMEWTSGNCKRNNRANCVYGTMFYDQDSDACLAGLHAGAVGIKGGEIIIQKKTISPGRIHGTCRNRVCSESINATDTVYQVKETDQVITEKVKGDVILVHNNYLNDNLDVVCMAEDPMTTYESNFLRTWNYAPVPRPSGDVYGSKVVVSTNQKSNRHAYHCLGKSPSSDILAPVNFQNGDYQQQNTPLITWRASIGDTLNIEINGFLNNGRPFSIRHFPDTTRTVNELNMTLHDAGVQDGGLYLVQHDGKEIYYDVIIRECKAENYGSECQHTCPKCQNGGQCHSYTGECICPSGFVGDFCQHACPKDWFGSKCQFRCNRLTLLFQPPDDGSCNGLTFCLPASMGCSCPPGYKGPFCNNRCEEGKYGAGCTESCPQKGTRGICDIFTGTCVDTAPSSPTNIRVSEDSTGRMIVSWDDNNSAESAVYIVAHKVYESSCRKDEEWKQTVQTEKSISLDSSDGFVSYNVCIITSIEKAGHSQQECMKAHSQIQAPTLQIDTVHCASEFEGKITCQANLKGNCTDFHGPNVRLVFSLQSFLACNDSLLTPKYGVVPLHSSSPSSAVTYTFEDLLPGQEYHPIVQVYNDAGEGNRLKGNLTTTSQENPPKVTEMIVSIRGKTKAKLFWNDPCPSNGELQSFQFYINGRWSSVEVLVKCDERDDYDHCVDIPGLSAAASYYLYLAVKNGAGWSENAILDFDTNEKQPGKPSIRDISREDRSLIFEVITPDQPGGDIINCTVTGPSIYCLFTSERINDMQCQMSDLEPGKRYKVEAFCCNEKFCGEILQDEVATRASPKFQGTGSVQEITNSTIILTLPKIVNDGDGNSSFAIVVEHIKSDEKQTQNLKAKALQLFKDITTKGMPNNDVPYDNNKRKKRETTPADGCQNLVRIAGVVPKTTSSFEIGDGKDYNGIRNCPLKQSESYNIGILGITELLGDLTETWQVLERVTVVQTNEAFIPAILGVFFMLLLIVIIIIAAYLHSHPEKINNIRMHFTKDGNKRTQLGNTPDLQVTRNNRNTPSRTPNRSPGGSPARPPHHFPNGSPVRPSRRPPAPLPSQHPAVSMSSLSSLPILTVSQDEPVYENIHGDEPIYGNLNRRIPRNEVESYLNRIISSAEAIEEFRSVPDNLKPMTIGKLPVHKRKNRFKNNLPYDETRVKLSIINNDPTTDYINANHVKGYGHNMRYIATQGPKDANVPTVADFWRMVVEQKATAIIMVANFVEEGKTKVAQYLDLVDVLSFDNFTIKVASYEHMPYFTLSRVEVYRDGQHQQDFLHYHYKNWPDHGVPEEAHSLASLLNLFLANNNEGCVVVHCSAGIGRTGTILLVLLLNEMLTNEGSMDPLEVLHRLRESRARLVENAVQYNLALEILDEVLFGNITTVTPDQLESQLQPLIKESHLQLKKAKALISRLCYKQASKPNLKHLNRNQNILPADSHMVYLRVVSSQADSQYINAIKIRGLRKEALVVTEHPMATTTDRFWRLIMEKQSSLVILLNIYSQMQEDFPPLLPMEGQVLNDGGHRIAFQSGQSYGSNLYQYSIVVTNTQGIHHSVTVYQVLNWEYGKCLPETPDILLTLAETLLSSIQSPSAGPPVLCCGDGVTGCGLVAGVTLLLERAQNEQLFDVYRTVVKLLRHRSQFIVNQEQFSMLYRVASLYAENFSIYANFK